MSRFKNVAAAAALAVSSLAQPSMLHAADLGTYNAGPDSPCEDRRFLNRIVDRFSYQVKHVPNLPNVGITDFHDIYETRYEPQGEKWPIGRLYCGATAELTDGQSREVWYVIEDRMGFAGIGQDVQFCVSGFDRWMVYDGRCRVLR